MARKAASTKKRTAHVDDASQPGTVLNVETNLLIAKKGTITEFCDEKAEAGRKVFRVNDAFSKSTAKKVDKEHLHRRAANDAYKLRQMDDEELHEYLFHFLFYIKDLGLIERAKKQEELFAAGEVGPGAKDKAHPDDNSAGDQTELEQEIEKKNGKANGHADGEDTTSARGRAGAAARQVEETAGERTH